MSGILSIEKIDFCKIFISVIAILGIYAFTGFVKKLDHSFRYSVLTLRFNMIKLHYIYDELALIEIFIQF